MWFSISSFYPGHDFIKVAGLALLFLLPQGCEKLGFTKVEKVEQRQSLTFPVSRSIKDVEGRELDVDILGRSSDDIVIERKSDGKRFKLPIDRLSDTDRAFVKTLPIKSAPQPQTAVAEATVQSAVPRYIEARLSDIEEIEAQIAQKNVELTAQDLDPITINSQRRAIKALEQRAEDFRRDIETYKRNNQL